MSKKLISFDWGMKSILRQEANFAILEGFLSELLKFNLKILQILEDEEASEEFNKIDILAEDEGGEQILVEILYNDEIDYFHSMLYGTAKLISKYTKKERGFRKVKKVYSINIVYFEIEQGEDYIYRGKIDFKGLHSDDTLELSQLQKDEFRVDEISDIYPDYYVLRINQFNDIAKNTLDEWIYFLKNGEIEDEFEAKGLSEARTAFDISKLEAQEVEEYEKKIENQRYKESLLHTAEVKGLKKGKQEGYKEGKLEARMEIAKNALQQGVDIETIKLITGLNEEIIKTLQ